MIRNKLQSGWILALIAAVIAISLGGATVADDRPENDPLLDRASWWPYASGPYYGEVPQEMRNHPRVIVLRAGSFDTRSPAWRGPQALLLAEQESLRPGSPWLVQLAGPITDDKKEMLRAAGATIYRFHPVNTFLVRAENPAALTKLPGVLWAGPYHPAYRVEPALGQAPTADPVKARNEAPGKSR